MRATLARIEQRVHGINGTAKVVRTHNADVPLERVLDVGAFDLERVLARDEDFLQPARPFEWAGVYALGAGTHELRLGAAPAAHAHHDHHHDHGHSDDQPPSGAPVHAHALEHVDMLLLPLGATERGHRRPGRPRAVQSFDGDGAVSLAAHATLPLGRLTRLTVGAPTTTWQLPLLSHCALFCEHAPEEFGLALEGARLVDERRYGSHHHDPDIGSIGLEDTRPLNADKVNDWLSYLLQSRGQDILRMKGVLNLKGEARRYVFHGVHMVYDGQLERPVAGRCGAPQPPGVHRPATSTAPSWKPGSNPASHERRRRPAQAAWPRRSGRLSGRCGLVARWQALAGRVRRRRLILVAVDSRAAGAPHRPAHGRRAGGGLAEGRQPVCLLGPGWRCAALGCAHADIRSSILTGKEWSEQLLFADNGRLLAVATGRALQLFDAGGRACAPNSTRIPVSSRPRMAPQINEIAAAGNGGMRLHRLEPRHWLARLSAGAGPA